MGEAAMGSSVVLSVVASLCVPTPPEQVLFHHSFFIPPAVVFTAGWVGGLPPNVAGEHEATFITDHRKVYRIRSYMNPGMYPGTKTYISLCSPVG